MQRERALSSAVAEGTVLRKTIKNTEDKIGPNAVLGSVNGGAFPPMSRGLVKLGTTPDKLEDLAKFIEHGSPSDVKELFDELKTHAKGKPDDDIIKYATALTKKSVLCALFLKSISKDDPERFISLALKLDPAHADMVVTMMMKTSGKTPDDLVKIAKKEYESGNKTLALKLADGLVHEKNLPSGEALDELAKIAAKEYAGGDKTLGLKLADKLLHLPEKNLPSENFQKRLCLLLIDHNLREWKSGKEPDLHQLVMNPDALIDHLKNQPGVVAKICKLCHANKEIKGSTTKILENFVKNNLKMTENKILSTFNNLKETNIALQNLTKAVEKEKPKENAPPGEKFNTLMQQKILEEKKYNDLNKLMADSRSVRESCLEVYSMRVSDPEAAKKAMKSATSLDESVLADINKLGDETRIFRNNDNYSERVDNLNKYIKSVKEFKFSPEQESRFLATIRDIKDTLQSIRTVEELQNVPSERARVPDRLTLNFHEETINNAYKFLEGYLGYLTAGGKVDICLKDLEKSESALKAAIEKLEAALPGKYQEMSKLGLDPAGIEAVKAKMNAELAAAQNSLSTLK